MPDTTTANAVDYALYDATDTEKLCEVMSVVYGLDRSKIVNKLYDGSVHVQTIGTPKKTYKLGIRVYSQADAIAMAEIEANNTHVQLHYKGATYEGILISSPSWSPVVRGKIYTATVGFVEV